MTHLDPVCHRAQGGGKFFTTKRQEFYFQIKGGSGKETCHRHRRVSEASRTVPLSGGTGEGSLFLPPGQTKGPMQGARLSRLTRKRFLCHRQISTTWHNVPPPGAIKLRAGAEEGLSWLIPALGLRVGSSFAGRGVARETYEPPPPQTWDWATKVSLQPLGGAQHQTRGDLKPAEREERPPLFSARKFVTPLSARCPGGVPDGVIVPILITHLEARGIGGVVRYIFYWIVDRFFRFIFAPFLLHFRNKCDPYHCRFWVTFGSHLGYFCVTFGSLWNIK